MLTALADARPQFAAFAGDVAGAVSSLDPETAAYRYLQQALASNSVREFTSPKADGTTSEFKSLGTESIPLTETTTVKFRQMFHKIPVYGSLVTVELDDKNECLAINSALGEPRGVDPVAHISPAQALATAAKHSGQRAVALQNTPRLSYYFDKASSKWRLVYITENVRVAAKEKQKLGDRRPVLMDYVVDAHSGKLIAELPRTPTVGGSAEQARDGLGVQRMITVEPSGKRKQLKDSTLNVATYQFGFRDPEVRSDLLPGAVVGNPPSPWLPEAVSAHANAEVVARFLREAVKRNNIDNAGGSMVSTVNCVVARQSRRAGEWLNAYWDPAVQQMVYGQRRKKDGSVFSMANLLDVVGHEMFHGVTDHTSRLEYVTQSGAMNESYSDIFGVLIANFQEADIGSWQWKLAVGLGGDGRPLRDMSDPTREGQPKRMRDYEVIPPPYGDNNDWGGVHMNSGIHNYAAYRVMTARSGNAYVLTPQELAAIFYITLTQHLSRNSQFRDSRRGAVLAAQTLFRNQPPATMQEKVSAVERGFADAGIT
jgi:Zn-dependent metalloprotease